MSKLYAELRKESMVSGCGLHVVGVVYGLFVVGVVCKSINGCGFKYFHN